jgi:hypothetical protein
MTLLNFVNHNARRGSGSGIRVEPAGALESVDHFENLFALGAGNRAKHDVDPRHGDSKQQANVGEKRGWREGRKCRKLLILLLELTRIELVTS